MMTEIKYIHLLRTEVISDALLLVWLSLLHGLLAKRRARVTRDGTICASNSTFAYFDGTNPSGKVLVAVSYPDYGSR